MSLFSKRTIVTLAIGLLALTAGAGPAAAKDAEVGRRSRMLKIRVYENDSKTPNVLVNIPMGVVSAFVKLAARSGALEAGLKENGVRIGGKEGVRIDGADLEDLWRQIETMEPGQIIEIQESGDRVDIRIE